MSPATRRFRPRRRKVYGRRPRVRPAAATVDSLAREVRLLKKKTRLVTQREQYRSSDATDVIAPYAALHLTDYTAWARLWPTTTQVPATVKSQMFHRYTIIDNLITLDNINNEEGLINFTYFVFSTRDAAGTLPTSLGVPSLTNNVDYSLVQGQAYLNLSKYKIHYMKRFTLTGGDGADMQADRSQIRFTARIKPMCKVVAVDQSWNALSGSPDPSDNLYHVLFNDNSSTDLENPRWQWTALHSVDQ